MVSNHYWIIRYLTTDYFGHNQYFGHPMLTVDSVEKPLVLGKTEGRRRRRYQRMRGLHGNTDAMDMNLGKRWEMVRDREASRAAVHGVTKNWTWLGNWATTTTDYQTSFLAGSEGKESIWNERPSFDPWVRKIPWRRKWLPTPVFLSKEAHGQRNLAG